MTRAQSGVIVCSQTPAFLITPMENYESTFCCNRLQSDTSVHDYTDGKLREHNLL
ncbi:hypothetical protein DPMN_104781 [Dreissena polymorpha]|uniref:Uncharacterized protein n=1 Tax=Dreissena polymorpha TaxID=45954 RepID=A0A9D4HG19_DREPO|nr:hypothetical protein DPMN_104781 [Dreissena polymorpha]